MDPYEALYGIQCSSPIGLFKVGESGLKEPNLVHLDMENVKVIREIFKTAQSHQKSYKNDRKGTLEFEVDDWVYLKVSPRKGVVRYGKKCKLSPSILAL